MFRIACIPLLFLFLGGVAAAAFPVAGGEGEFREVLAVPLAIAKSHYGDERLFRMLSLPYGPLGFEITKPRSHEESSHIKNYYLGVTGAAMGVNPQKISKSFHCGSTCRQSRKGHLVENLSRVKEVVEQFRSYPQIQVISIWGIPGEYRVNDLYYMQNSVWTAGHTSTYGFYPVFARQKKGLTKEEYSTQLHHMEQVGDSAIVDLLFGLKVAALTKIPNNTIEVVLTGIGDNQARMRFSSEERDNPQVGDQFKNGIEIVYVSCVERTICYFETS